MYISIIMIIAASSCAFKTSNQNKFSDNIEGTYHYVRDSVNNPNSRFFEEIIIKEGGDFIYKTRIGSFIKNEIKGKWKLEKGELILNDILGIKDNIIPIECTDKEDNYSFLIRNSKGHKINYSLIIDGNLNSPIREQFDVSLFNKNNIDKVQVMSTSGRLSKEFSLKSNSDKKCYKISINESRYFDNEKWKIESNKLRPRGMDGKPAEYYLYKR